MADLTSYSTAWTIERWKVLLEEAQSAPRWGLDFETKPDTNHPAKDSAALRAEQHGAIAGIGIAWRNPEGDMRSVYIGIRHDPQFAGGPQPSAHEALRILDEAIGRYQGIVVVANLAMELSFMLRENVRWPEPGKIHDVQIACRVLNKGVGPKEFIGLKLLQASVLGKDMASKNDMDRWLKEHRFKPGRDIWRAPVSLAGVYCQDDSRDALDIWERWESQVYRPPTEWWWSRPPDKTTRFDLYELEIEVAVDSLIAGLRGTRVDLQLCRRRATASMLLQASCATWIRERMKMPTINPGSADQLRGVLFGPMGFEVARDHLTDAFRKLGDRDQSLVMKSKDLSVILPYASLDVDALEHYGEVYPEHSDLMFMLAVYRKCTKAVEWFLKNVDKWAETPCADPWWDGAYDGPSAATPLLNLIFHRLRTVGTISGRMSSSDYNAQQLPKRFKMLIAAERLTALLAQVLPENQLRQVVESCDTATVKNGDEAAGSKVPVGGVVFDFSVRRMLTPRPGMRLRGFDLSQVEMKGFAHYSGNKLLCDGYGAPLSDEQANQFLAACRFFMETRGRLPSDIDVEYHHRLDANPFDIHKFVAQEIEITRKEAKGINFGIVYGMGERKLARERGWTMEQGKLYLGKYHRKFQEIHEIQLRIRGALQKRGYVFDTFGRRYYLSTNKAYVGLNRLIQGWAAGMFKLGVVRMCDVMEALGDGKVHPITRRKMPTGSRLLTCVHDEALNEVTIDDDTPEFDWVIRTCMTVAHGLLVPLSTSSESSEESWDSMEAA